MFLDIKTDSFTLDFISLVMNKIVSRNMDKVRVGNVPGFLKGTDINGDIFG